MNGPPRAAAWLRSPFQFMEMWIARSHLHSFLRESNEKGDGGAFRTCATTSGSYLAPVPLLGVELGRIVMGLRTGVKKAP